MSGEKLRTTEVDGVPVLWMPGEGKLRASLWFRAGAADETLPTRGWLQLLADLAGQSRTSVNGQLGLLHTRFDVEGEPDDVAALLRSLCQWLATPDLSNLGQALDVLHDKDESQDPRVVVGRHLYWRYGARGPGLAGAHEFGYHTATPERLRELAGRAYAQGNAALALSGPPPAGLELPLRPGPRVLTTPARPVDQPLPGGFGGKQHAIGLSGVVTRSPAAEALVRSLKRGLQQGLGLDSDPGDSAWASYELVDSDHAMLTAGMDVSPDALPVLLRESTAVVRRLRDQGPDPTELRDDLIQRIQRYSSQPVDHWLPADGVRDLLLGRPVTESADELAAETDAVTVAAVQREALELWKNLLVSVDPSVVAEPELTWLSPPASDRTSTGVKFQTIGSPVTKDILTVGPTATALETEHGAVTVWYDELAGLLAYADGGRCLVRLDGHPVRIEPTLWRDGQQAITIIDSSVQPWLRIPLPERSPDEIPEDKVRRIDRLRYWTNRPVVSAPLLIVVLVAVILFASQEEAGKWGVWLIPVILGGGLVGYLRHRRQRS